MDTMGAVAPIEIAQAREAPLSASDREAVFETRGLTVSYGKAPAVSNVDLPIYRNLVTAIIGPSGCGKSTFLRSLNRMNDLIPSAKVDGRSSTTARTSTATGLTQSRCDGELEWSSRSRTRSRSRSTTTSPGACACLE